MKKMTMLLLTTMFILSSAAVFADDNQNATDQNALDQSATDQNAGAQNPPAPAAPEFPAMNKNFPRPSELPFPSASGMMGEAPKTVVATSDGGIVIVQGNTITKLDKDLIVTKSVELAGAENTGDKNTK